jgi:YfiR/HmsC-like
MVNSRALARWLAFALLAGTADGAHSQSATEAELKAAYLFNFALFVEWPQGGPPTFTICQHGTDTLGAGALALARRTLHGKAITVRNVADNQFAGCDVLYISSSEKSRIRALTSSLRGMNVLTVSDAPGAARDGATIGLSVEGKKIVFEVNIAEARKSNLVISAKLLDLARSVLDPP